MGNRRMIRRTACVLALVTGMCGISAGEGFRSLDAVLGDFESQERAAQVVKKGNAPVKPENVPPVYFENITFELNKADLRPEAKRQLDEIARALSSEQLANKWIMIQGHTCNRGAYDRNMTLSRDRAESVRDYLARQGNIDAGRFRTKGFGMSRPKFNNDGEANRARNRRVEFVLMDTPPVDATVSRSIVPVREAPRDFLDVAFLAKRQGEDAFTPISSGAVLKTGDAISMRFTVLEGCHVHFLTVGASGHAAWLYPLTEVSYGRWHDAGGVMTLPMEGSGYPLQGPAGDEAYFVIASPQPLAQADNLPEIMKKCQGDVDRIRERLDASAAQIVRFEVKHQ